MYGDWYCHGNHVTSNHQLAYLLFRLLNQQSLEIGELYSDSFMQGACDRLGM